MSPFIALSRLLQMFIFQLGTMVSTEDKNALGIYWDDKNGFYGLDLIGKGLGF